MNSVWRKIPLELAYYIFNFLNIYDASRINRKFRKLSVIRAVRRIGRFYYSRKLVFDSPHLVTSLRVMKRYYVVKYKKEWLQNLPREMSRAMRIPFMEYEHPEQCVRNFYNFCDINKITINDFIYFGW